MGYNSKTNSDRNDTRKRKIKEIIQPKFTMKMVNIMYKIQKINYLNH